MGTFGGDRRRRAALIAILLPVLGAWLGHGVEAFRVSGGDGLRAAVTGPVHLYMLPAGAVLALAVTLAGVRCWLLLRELERRLSRARLLLRLAWRGRAAGLDPPPPSPSRAAPGAGSLRLWPLLALAQLGLYVLQENVETVLAGGRLPGVGVLAGVHRPVVAVQLGVALVLAGAVAVVLRLLDRRGRLAAGCERLVRALLLRGRRPAARRRGLLWLRPPCERHGVQLWCRPPPLSAV